MKGFFVTKIFFPFVRAGMRKGRKRKESGKGKEGRKVAPLSVPSFPLGFRFASRSLAVRSAVPAFVPVRSCAASVPLCVPVSFPFASLCCAAVRFRLRSVSVLLAAGQDRTAQQGSTGTKQGHGDRLKRFRPGRNGGGGVGDTRHFVHSYGLRGDAPSSLCTFLHVTGGAIPSIPFLCSSCPSCGPPCVPAVVPFRPACSSEFLVSFQERSSAWKW